MKVTVQKATGEGEYISVEAQVPGDVLKNNDKVRLRRYLAPGFDLIDDRLFEMNRRIIMANKLVKQASPDVQFIIHSVLEGMHGMLYRGAGSQVQVTKELEDKVGAMVAKAQEDTTEALKDYPGSLANLDQSLTTQ